MYSFHNNIDFKLQPPPRLPYINTLSLPLYLPIVAKLFYACVIIIHARKHRWVYQLQEKLTEFLHDKRIEHTVVILIK